MDLFANGCQTLMCTFFYNALAGSGQSNPADTAKTRFLTILLSGIIGLIVIILVLPSWAGDKFHEHVSKNFDSLADSLPVCVNEYLQGVALERVPSQNLLEQAADDPVYKGYSSILNSAAEEKSLAKWASWEPPHGRFRMFKYPWQNYVKVGAALRHCAYSVAALHTRLRSAIQAPPAVRALLKDELCNLSEECANVLRNLGLQVNHMQKGDRTTLLDGVRTAIDRLQQSLYLHLRPAEDFANHSVSEQRAENARALSQDPFATLLMEVASRLDFVAEAVEELGELARFKPITREQPNCAEV